jgi:predicted nucleic acid-binding protein
MQVHDARLIAAMTVHGINNILTLNTRDLARYPGINALEPSATR